MFLSRFSLSFQGTFVRQFYVTEKLKAFQDFSLANLSSPKQTLSSSSHSTVKNDERKLCMIFIAFLLLSRFALWQRTKVAHCVI